VIAYALVDEPDERGHQMGDVIDVYVDRDAAVRERGIVGNETDWEPFLPVVELELAARGLN
jgi:hypothetical protein